MQNLTDCPYNGDTECIIWGGNSIFKYYLDELRASKCCKLTTGIENLLHPIPVLWRHFEHTSSLLQEMK
jgi:hypothetical protein